MINFHFGCVTDVNVFTYPEEVDDDCDGERGLGGCDGDGKERKEHAFHLAGEKETVKHDKIDIDRVEHQLERNQDGNHVFAGDETVDSAAEHNQTGNQVIYSCNFHNFRLTSAGDNYATDYTCQ